MMRRLGLFVIGLFLVSALNVDRIFGAPSPTTSENMNRKKNPLFRSEMAKLRSQSGSGSGSGSGSSFGGNPYNASCTIKPNVTDSALSAIITYVCESTPTDCGPIEAGGSHYIPNTPLAHASWAVNAYFWANSDSDESCDFGGAAQLTCDTSKSWPKIRGVDIGGWLVLEPWITPSIFQQFVNKTADQTAVDQYTFCQILGAEEATAQLTTHWNTWFNETDVAFLSKVGLNTLRIPVGYWIFGDYPPFIGSLDQLDRGIQMALDYGLAVIIDLHGAPGSQNGFDNSGRACGKCAGVCPPEPTWSTNATNINITIDVLVKLAERYYAYDNVIGIELLNEPRWDINLSILYDFYTRAYHAIRNVAPDLTIMFHDSFRYNAWVGFMTPEQGFENILLDTHVYEAFASTDITNSESGHLLEACGYATMINYMECMEQPVVTGEWSLGVTDCPQWLLGFEQPPTAPGLGVPCPHNETNSFLMEYAANQINTFERGRGWFFWNFKTETAPYWSWIDAVSNGWVPADVSSLPFNVTNACN